VLLWRHILHSYSIVYPCADSEHCGWWVEARMVPIRCGAIAPDAVRGRVPRDANMRYPMGALGRGYRGFSPRRTARYQQRAIGSAGERLVHTEEVTGSIPVSPTQLRGRL
jgi:hypothetical protein